VKRWRLGLNFGHDSRRRPLDRRRGGPAALEPVAEPLALPARAQDLQERVDLGDVHWWFGVDQPQALLGPPPQLEGLSVGQLAIGHDGSLLGPG
jgi:hypothetical protein